MPRALLVLPLAALIAARSADASGTIIAGMPSKLHMEPGTQISLHASGLRWTSRTGRTVRQTLARPVLSSEGLEITPPPGEWTDVVLLIDGPVLVSGTDDGVPFSVVLDLEALTVPLEQPVSGGTAVQLSLSLELPEHLGLGVGPLSEGGRARLGAALQDGALLSVVP